MAVAVDYQTNEENEEKQQQESFLEGTSPKQTHTKKSMCFIYIIIVLNLVLVVTLFSLIITWRVRRGRKSPGPAESFTCLPPSVGAAGNGSECDQALTPFDGQCCGPARKVLALIAEQVVEEEHKKNVFNLNDVMPCPGDKTDRLSLRLSGIKQKTLNGSRNGLNLVYWDPNETETETEALSYEEGHIEIKKPGIYFIYSQIEFLIDHGKDKTMTEHFLYRKSRENEVTKLLEGSRCNCEASSGSRFSSNHLGSIFRLNTSDSIFVNVSHPELLNVDQPKGNFFGLYKI